MNFSDIDYRGKVAGTAGGLLIEALQMMILALAVSVVSYLFFAIPNQVDGVSMFPNLHDGEVLLTNKFIQIAGGAQGILREYDYQRGDIVVFQKPGMDDLVKRIIAGPGDRVKIENEKIYVNDKLLIEDYLPAGTATVPGPFLLEGIEKRVPSDSVFVLGDNRMNSKDSRTVEVGFVERKYIKGSPFMRVFPLNRFGVLERGKYKEVAP